MALYRGPMALGRGPIALGCGIHGVGGASYCFTLVLVMMCRAQCNG